MAIPYHLMHAESVRMILHKLNIPISRYGYEHLCIGVPLYKQNPTQNLTKELYPRIAEATGASDWRTVETAIRSVICDAWEQRDPEVWEQYFPGATKAPSNKVFIATLAEYSK